MKKNWSERKGDTTKVEIRFEKLLKENNFNIIGMKEFISKTDYLIEKDGVECVFAVHRVDNKPSRGNVCFELFNDYFNLKVKDNKKG